MITIPMKRRGGFITFGFLIKNTKKLNCLTSFDQAIPYVGKKMVKVFPVRGKFITIGIIYYTRTICST